VKMRIKSQLYSDAEAQKKVGAILDDCGPSSAAAAVAYVNGYNPDLQASDGVAAKARATGFTEKQGVSDNGSSLPELMKTVRELGGKAKPADTFAEAVEAAKAGAALIVWVQAPSGYPAQALSKWHRNWASYWQKKDPKVIAEEQFAVPITEADLKAIASGKPGSPASHIVIVTKKEKA